MYFFFRTKSRTMKLVKRMRYDTDLDTKILRRVVGLARSYNEIYEAPLSKSSNEAHASYFATAVGWYRSPESPMKSFSIFSCFVIPTFRSKFYDLTSPGFRSCPRQNLTLIVTIVFLHCIVFPGVHKL